MEWTTVLLSRVPEVPWRLTLPTVALKTREGGLWRLLQWKGMGVTLDELPGTHWPHPEV